MSRKFDKSLTAGSTSMLLLKLLEQQDLYGYQMIEELEKRSDHSFSLKAGTLYPLLHSMEQQKLVWSYEQEENGRMRKYYSLTSEGRECLAQKQQEWEEYSQVVTRFLKGGAFCGAL